jgi:transcriptional regulator with XRE-family HTH domain
MKLVLLNNEQRVFELGKRIQAARTRQNITRHVLAAKSGVPYGTLRTLEETGHGAIKNYLSIMKVLGMDLNFEQFIPQQEGLTPLEIMRKIEKQRKRARTKKPNTDQP